MNITLINGWKTFWRWWSTWLTGASAIILFLPEITEHLLYAYSIIPMDLKSTFPEEWSRYIGAGLGFLAFVSRFIRQRKSHEIASKERSLGGSPEGQPPSC